MEPILQIVLPLLGALGGGIGAYAAIRADLAALKAQVAAMQESLSRAHVRIDNLLQG